MMLPDARGEVSDLVLGMLQHSRPGVVPPLPEDVLTDGDVQLALWCLYELHHHGFVDVDPDREWDPDLLAVRRILEQEHLHALRRLTQERIEAGESRSAPLERMDVVLAPGSGPSVAAHLHRDADTEQFRDHLRQRSVYHLKESDPHAFVVPRIDGRAKVALAELQYDEFGAGRPEALHSRLFADAMRACGLDDGYGAYVDEARPGTLAVNTTMSLFGLHRRWRGAAMGHLAAFESTSSLPSRRIASGARRLGLPEEVAHYYDEHVEADAVHEQLAVRDICATLVSEDPALLDDVLFGMAACIELDALAGEEWLARWQPATAGAVG